LRQLGRPVPPALCNEERIAAICMISAVPLLKVIRERCDGPLVLMKGAEIAVRYPGGARGFGDIDVLVPDAHAVHAQLLAAGFVDVGDPERHYGLHQMRPLAWPNLPLSVEI